MSEQAENPGQFEHVYEPPPAVGAEAPATTLLLLHGTGGDERDLLALGRQVAPDCGLLSPRGKVLEGGVSRRFFRRYSEGHLDIADLIARSDELAGFVEERSRVHDFDPKRVVAIGFSNGANMAVGLLFRRPGLLRAAALLRPMLPYEPNSDLDLSGTAVLIAAGGRDPLIPVEQPQELAAVLGAARAQVTSSLNETAGHGLDQSDFTDLADWFSGLS
jgi:predicted esterase